jgi:hypothetical protein
MEEGWRRGAGGSHIYEELALPFSNESYNDNS